MMKTYLKKQQAGREAVSQKPADITKSEMLHMSGAGAPQPMSPALREKFEPSFGADFSNIRISRGHIPEEMGVQAVAKGTDLLVDSRAGMDVIGHELAHVVQQAQGQVQGGFPVVHNAALEHQADVMGARAASGLSAMEGGMSGLGGGEMMSIAPMTSAAAPAQCKSLRQKKMAKHAPEMWEHDHAAPVQGDPNLDKYANSRLWFPKTHNPQVSNDKGETTRGRGMDQQIGLDIDALFAMNTQGSLVDFQDHEKLPHAPEKLSWFDRARGKKRSDPSKRRTVNLTSNWPGQSALEELEKRPEDDGIMGDLELLPLDEELLRLGKFRGK